MAAREDDPVQASLESLRHAITTALSAADALALQLTRQTNDPSPDRTAGESHASAGESPAATRDPSATDLPGPTLGIDNTDTALSGEVAGSQADDSTVSDLLASTPKPERQK